MQLIEPGQVKPQAKQGPFAVQLQRARILIVEDDLLVATIAHEMVENLGGVVTGTARSVAAAKEKIQQTELDCVMLDVNLNGELSLGIAAELQKRAIPFVFCTAYTHAFDQFEQVPRITKPFTEQELMQGLEAALTAKCRHPGH